MSIFAIITATGLALSGSQAGPSVGTVDQSEDGTLVGGGGKKKGGKKKGGKKKGGKKKGGKKKGGKKKAELSDASRDIAPWGKADLIVAGGIGLSHGLMREAAETGMEGESGSGAKANACSDDDCVKLDAKTNAATGWGPAGRVTLMFPGVGKTSHSAGPIVGFSRSRFTLEGLEHPVPGPADEGGLNAAVVTDRADYDLRLQQLDLGIAWGWKFAPKSPFFGLLSFNVGYAWGSVDTTVQSAPAQVSLAKVGGLGFIWEMGLGMSLGKSAHVMVLPALHWVSLRSDQDDEAFPFLKDGMAETAMIPVKITAMAAF